MVEIARYQVGEVALTRVPYFDIALDADVVHLTADQIAAIDWAAPYWATDDRRVLIGQAVWVIDSGGHLIVVDPCLAADPFLRSGPEAVVHQEAVLAALRAAPSRPSGSSSWCSVISTGSAWRPSSRPRAGGRRRSRTHASS